MKNGPFFSRTKETRTVIYKSELKIRILMIKVERSTAGMVISSYRVSKRGDIPSHHFHNRLGFQPGDDINLADQGIGGGHNDHVQIVQNTNQLPSVPPREIEPAGAGCT